MIMCLCVWLFARMFSALTSNTYGARDQLVVHVGVSLWVCGLGHQIMSVGANVPTTFWSTAGQQPYNPGNEPFLKFLTVLSTTSDDSFPRTLSVSYGDNEPTVNFGYAERVNTEFKKLGTGSLLHCWPPRP